MPAKPHRDIFLRWEVEGAGLAKIPFSNGKHDSVKEGLPVPWSWPLLAIPRWLSCWQPHCEVLVLGLMQKVPAERVFWGRVSSS